VGRTDLPGGDARVLAHSIERLWTLPDETIILSGHGDSTTIGSEKQHNDVAQQLLEGIR
jgi:hydroxyacylglutathione hydrolase